jgi:hypothetical protein
MQGWTRLEIPECRETNPRPNVKAREYSNEGIYVTETEITDKSH